MPMGKFRAQTLPCSMSEENDGQGFAKLVVGVLPGVVALLLRAEDLLHFRVVIEERKEDRDTLNDRGAKLRLDPLPIIIEPALHGLKLRQLFGISLVWVEDRASFGWNASYP